MNAPEIDIVVTVWNRPVETRNCLVNLVEHAPTARLVLVDNGSDRETERLLQEFAEALDQRALLLREDTNQGHVRAINRGLARAEAPYLAVVRNTSLVTEGWLEPLLAFGREKREAGIMVPRLIPETSGRIVRIAPTDLRPIEVGHGSLAAMLLRKELFEAIGGLDEELDGGLWCLADYSRRAGRSGFLSFKVEGGAVYYRDDVPFGSTERREATVQRSSQRYRERWGDAASFCIHLPKGADLNILRQRLDVLLQGARQGHLFTLLVPGKLYDEAARAGYLRLHEQISFKRLPLLFETGATARALAAANETMPGTRAVTGIDGMPFPGGVESVPFAELERLVTAIRSEKYGN
jgi:glycosyltransferase involved in cell wall biosynthesis